MFQNINGCTKNELKSTLAINHSELVEFLQERPTIPVTVAELMDVVTEQAYEECQEDALGLAIEAGLDVNFDFAVERVEVLS